MNEHPTWHVPRLAAAAAVLLLVGACGTRTGDLGSVAPPSSQEPSLAVPSSEPTPGGVSPAPSGPVAPTATPSSPGDTPAPTTAGTMTVRAYFFLGSFVDNAGL